jgi:hypothetical protein
MNDKHKQLLKFYDVETLGDLVDEQEKHIARLQKQVPPMRDQFPTSYRR